MNRSNYAGDKNTEQTVSVPEFMKEIYALGKKRYGFEMKDVDKLIEDAAKLNRILYDDDPQKDFERIKDEASCAKQRLREVLRM